MGKFSLGTLILSGLMSFAGKMITAFGLGFVSYAGLDYMQDKFVGWISQQIGSFPVDAASIFYMAGGVVVLNWIFGAITFIATIKTTSHLTASLKK